jgi:hypothetical protein
MYDYDFPMLRGAPVTEAHARICRERGHAVHSINGVASDRCPRCGDLRKNSTTTDAFAEDADSATAIAIRAVKAAGVDEFKVQAWERVKAKYGQPGDHQWVSDDSFCRDDCTACELDDIAKILEYEVPK